jgi:putative SOS response-associated peptidase YedK
VCGRYVAATDAEGVMRLFVVDQRQVDDLPPSYNVAPTDPVPAVVEHGGARHLVRFRWGLVPHWSADRRNAARLINARAETAADKPAFRDSLDRRRCILPADGFYEWERSDGRRLPWFIRARDRRPLALAGVWATWRDPTDPGAPPLRTCAILTTRASDDVAELHDRMPVVLEGADWDRWLDRSLDTAAAVTDLLGPARPGRLERYRVGTEVNSVANNHPGLLDPVAA